MMMRHAMIMHDPLSSVLNSDQSVYKVAQFDDDMVGESMQI